MPRAVAVSPFPRPRTQSGLQGTLLVLRLLVLWLGCCVLARAAEPPPAVEVGALSAARSADAIELDYQLRVALPPTVEDAARRGVPLYFVATATLWKPRWYWRDERIARVRREWRLTYQPLTSSWRVSQGGLGQSHATLAEALSMMTRGTAWRIAEAAQAEADGKHYVEFEWVLDTAQLPRPLQIGVTGVGGGEWDVGARRTFRLDAAPAEGVGKAETKP